MDYEIDARELAEQPTAVSTTTLTVNEIGPWLGTVYSAVAEVLARAHAGPAGPPFARYRMLGDARFDVEAGFPALQTIVAEGDVTPSTLPSGPAAHTVHVGPYDAMEPAYAALDAWIREHGFEPNGAPREVYLSDPSTEPDPATWRTEVYAPYRA
jgi:effector-binding domain-containing protein